MRILLACLVLFLVGCNQPSTSTVEPTTTPAPVAAGLQPDVQLDKESYRPGEQINVTVIGADLSADGWVGIVPPEVAHGSEATNDQYDLDFRKLEELSGLNMAAPLQPGRYEMRLNDSDDDGKEVAARGFEVKGEAPGQVKLELSAESFKPGEKIVVRFEAPAGFDRSAWIGVVPSVVEHGKESVNDENDAGYVHLDGRTIGTAELVAPPEPGNYDVRLNDSDSDGKEVASASFTVK
ncbi:MAG: hypothetical protein AB7S38_12130 [Vulcanimicrobiota bacterium]